MPIYIVIVTYNGAQWIHKCIASALASDCAVDIVVVDNNSSDNTLDIIRSLNIPNINILETGKNLGFGQANNLGIKYAIEKSAEYIYLLNQDAYLELDTISGLRKLMEKYPQYGILSPMQYNGNGSKFDANFNYILLNLQKNGVNLSDEILDTEFVMAAHWLVSTALFERIGIFDPIFKHYGEDDDLINRAIYHGYKIGIATHIKAYHDREERIVSTKYAVRNLYRSLLSICTNINYSIFTVFKKVLVKILRDLYSRMKKGILSCIIYHVYYFFALLLKVRIISRVRYMNKNNIN